MRAHAESLGLAGAVSTILRELIHDRLGLNYAATEMDQLADRLAPLVVARGLGSFMDYYYLLKYSDDEAEWGRVMDALSVPETYFWREMDQVRALVDEVIPALVDRSEGRPIRIWSVPCAGGEEPLTIAMMLAEHGWFARAPIEITGSDASPAAVIRARTGHFGARAFRSLPPELQEKYFVPMGDRWAVAADLHARVTFDHVNLMDADAVAQHANVPVIFCRNVFIYFSEAQILRTVQAFAGAMPVPAFLCLGVSESLLRFATPFELADIGGAFVYVKGGADAWQPSVSGQAAAKGHQWSE